jgi:hypothetical protein
LKKGASERSLSVLNEPQKYFDEHEEIGEVPMQVLKGMQEKLTAKYQRTHLSNKPDFKRFGMRPEEKDLIDE